MQIDPAELKGRKIGRVLTKLGRVTRERVHEALAIQKTRKVPLGQLLVELGYCTQRDVQEALAGQAGMAFIDLQNYSLSDEVRDAIAAETVQAYQVVPIDYNPRSKRLKIAMKSADNFRAVDDLRLLMGFNVEAVVADPAEVDSLIKKHYSKQEAVADVVSALASDDKFKALGATVIGVSHDKIDVLNRFSVQECRNKFAVAADPEKKITTAYDAVLFIKPEYANRTSYVISPEGKIIYEYTAMSPDKHVANTMAAVQAWVTAHPH